MKKVAIIYGTRPEIVKLASTILQLEKENKVNIVKINTGQHKELAQETLDVFQIKDDYNLDVMTHGQSLNQLASKIISKLEEVIIKEKPDAICVLGDTTTALCGALTSVYMKIPLIHIEAGCRSHNKEEPFPEEINRIMIDHIAKSNLCYDDVYESNLISEGLNNSRKIDSPAVDAVRLVYKETKKEKQVLITMHRRENWGNPHKNVCRAINVLAKTYPDYKFIISSHPNEIVRNSIKTTILDLPNIEVREHMKYDDFISTLGKSMFVISDSGGISHEAPSLDCPIIMIRNVCENEQLILNRLAILTGTDTEAIVNYGDKLITDKDFRKSMIACNPYGDGYAYKEIIRHIYEVLEE